MEVLGQAVIDVCAFFMGGFVIVVCVDWLTSLFRRN